MQTVGNALQDFPPGPSVGNGKVEALLVTGNRLFEKDFLNYEGIESCDVSDVYGRGILTPLDDNV